MAKTHPSNALVFRRVRDKTGGSWIGVTGCQSVTISDLLQGRTFLYYGEGATVRQGDRGNRSARP